MVKFSNNHKSHKKSNKIPLKLKYSIQKKVKEHYVRIKGEARKMQKNKTIRKKPKKDIEIPNSYPHKGEMIDALINRRNQTVEKKIKEKAEKIATKVEKKSDSTPDYDILTPRLTPSLTPSLTPIFNFFQRKRLKMVKILLKK